MISEAYVNGSAAKAAFTNRFIEFYNPTDAPVTLTGSIAAGGHYLIQATANSGPAGAELPTADASGAFNSSGASGTVALVNDTKAITLPIGSVTNNPAVIDLVGYGSSNTYEDAAATGQSAALSLNRTEAKDSDNNSADFAAEVPSPCSTTSCAGGEEPPGEPVAATIEQIQGDGPELANTIKVGDALSVTGTVSESGGLTKISADSFQLSTEPQPAVKPTPVEFPLSEVQREALEGMLIQPQGTYTITNNYTTNQYDEIGLAPGDSPLRQPSNEARPGSAAYNHRVAHNADSLITLDDGASTNFFSADKQGTPSHG